MIEILGLIGAIFTLLGSLLLINNYIALKSMRKKVESASGNISFKFFRKMIISILEHKIKVFPDHPYIEIMMKQLQLWKSNNLPNPGKVVEQLKAKREQIKANSEKMKANKWHKNIKKSRGVIKEIQNSFMLKAMVFNNPYFLIAVILVIASKAMELFQKQQLKIGIFFLITGQIFMIIEKISKL